MKAEKTEIAVLGTSEIAKQLNEKVFNVLGENALIGFERAYSISSAIGDLKTLLTPEYMKPIMQLQGNRLGFKTDKDKSGGYDEATVKNCLIEAVLMGLQPYGNQFNIIAGNTYPTKEGTGYLLNNSFKGLKFDIVVNITKTSPDGKSALAEATINWTINEVDRTKVVPIPIKTDAYTGVDAIIGKATRKARAWLISALSGIEITDGDVTDVEGKVISTKLNVDHEADRFQKMLADCKTTEDVFKLSEQCKTQEQKDLCLKRGNELMEA